MGTHFISTTLFSIRSLQTRRSKSVCRSVGICPVVVMWSNKDLASVMRYPLTTRRSLQRAATSCEPVSSMWSTKRMYRWRSAAKHIEHASAAMDDLTTRVLLLVVNSTTLAGVGPRVRFVDATKWREANCDFPRSSFPKLASK